MSQIVSWTAVAESLPTEDGAYLVYAPSGDPAKPLIAKARYESGYGWSLLPDNWLKAITHWMPMPKPPDAE